MSGEREPASPRMTVTVLCLCRLSSPPLGMTSLGCPSWSWLVMTRAIVLWLGALLQKEGKTPPRVYENTGLLVPTLHQGGCWCLLPLGSAGCARPRLLNETLSVRWSSTEKSIRSFFQTSPTSPDSDRSPMCPMLNTCSVCVSPRNEGGGFVVLKWVETSRLDNTKPWVTAGIERGQKQARLPRGDC